VVFRGSVIASVRGRVLAVRLDAAVIEVGGVGLLVRAAPATLAGLRPGEEARLATSLVVREDALTLFGFTDDDERDVFETVRTVSGVGPRLALAMLAVHTPDGLRAAVTDQDLNALVKVPGIGRKGAQRIVLELSGRLGAPTGVVSAADSTQRQGPGPSRREQVVEALVGLGWSVKQAGDAVDAVEDTADSAPADVAGVLRSALRHLGRAG
jgi:Holliday junction DNA helicase RuvA